ncbi:hypothetical protein LXA43DRAFT_893623 [Ganoderma leucocontextum]|nr:hypothetical protein LXA43DRAFT_893623 [Ganoderma leucocontextum]
MSCIIWLLQQCGVSGVPSLKSFRAMQARLRQCSNVTTVLKLSPRGTIFYQNPVPGLIAQDWANEKVRPYIEEYPIRSSTISESYHADKRHKHVPPEVSAPMWADGGKHYFVGEIAALRDGRLVIPKCWYRRQSHGDVLAEVWETGVYIIRDASTFEINSNTLEHNACDIVGSDGAAPLTHWKGTCPQGLYTGLSPLRAVACGRRMYTSFIRAWGDDVSGNTSKQYNAHTNIYVAHANIPHDKLSQEYFVKFHSTSQHATSGEQFDSMVQDMTGSNTWHVMYDCELREEILVRILPETLPADNPQQSATCSHVGLKGNKPCRKCEFGGTERERETDQGYEQHFSPGAARTVENTLTAIQEQIRAAALGVAKTVSDLQTKTGVKDPLAEYWIQQLITQARDLQQVRIKNSATRDPRLVGKRGLARIEAISAIEDEIRHELLAWLFTQPPADYDALPSGSALRSQLRPGIHYNGLLVIDSLDVHRDTPVELLHTYLLGVDKYLWYHTHNSWTDTQASIFAIRLQASSIDALSIPPLRAAYMLQYKNSLIGKHFKALQQLSIFHLDDSLAPPVVQDLWKAQGELGAMLWYPKIENMDDYISDVTILIGNLLDIWSTIDPSRIFVKTKLHILPHIIDDIRNHANPILYATEIFECFNAVFRQCSVLSNHLAPSRDIALTCASMERFKHIVSGGWWRDTGNEQYVQAGASVRRHFEDTHLQRRLGFAPTKEPISGAVRCLGKVKKTPGLTFEAMGIAPLAIGSIPTPSTSLWHQCLLVISKHGDVCKPESWVFAAQQGSTVVGRITHILSPVPGRDSTNDCVIMKTYTILDSPHPHFNMPELYRSQTDTTYTTDILFAVNVQHNCRDAGCSASGRRAQRQERIDTIITVPVLEHKGDTNYLLNTHALHNAALLRKAIPRALTEPKPYFNNRDTEHRKMAAALREVHIARRKKDAEARQARKEKRAADKAAATSSGPAEGSGEHLGEGEGELFCIRRQHTC